MVHALNGNPPKPKGAPAKVNKPKKGKAAREPDVVLDIVKRPERVALDTPPVAPQPAKPATCFNCGQEGHMRADCPAGVGPAEVKPQDPARVEIAKAVRHSLDGDEVVEEEALPTDRPLYECLVVRVRGDYPAGDYLAWCRAVFRQLTRDKLRTHPMTRDLFFAFKTGAAYVDLEGVSPETIMVSFHWEAGKPPRRNFALIRRKGWANLQACPLDDGVKNAAEAAVFVSKKPAFECKLDGTALDDPLQFDVVDFNSAPSVLSVPGGVGPSPDEEHALLVASAGARARERARITAFERYAHKVSSWDDLIEDQWAAIPVALSSLVGGLVGFGLSCYLVKPVEKMTTSHVIKMRVEMPSLPTFMEGSYLSDVIRRHLPEVPVVAGVVTKEVVRFDYFHAACAVAGSVVVPAVCKAAGLMQRIRTSSCVFGDARVVSTVDERPPGMRHAKMEVPELVHLDATFTMREGYRMFKWLGHRSVLTRGGVTVEHISGAVNAGLLDLVLDVNVMSSSRATAADRIWTKLRRCVTVNQRIDEDHPAYLTGMAAMAWVLARAVNFQPTPTVQKTVGPAAF